MVAQAAHEQSGGMPKHQPSIPLNLTLAQNIRAYRAALGLSQEALAERSGIKRTYIGAVERGEVDPRLATVGKIAAGLGTDAYKLLQPGSWAGTAP